MKTLPLILLLLITYLPSFAHITYSGKPVFIVAGEGKEGYSTNSRTVKIEDSGLWLLTARITESYTMQRDTLISFNAGNKKWDKEKHVTVKTVSRGEITAVIENQAETPAKDFMYNSDSGEPISITVSGEGSNTESSNYLETIDGTMINADIRNDNVSGAADPHAGIQFEYSDDNKYIDIGIGINAKGSYKGRMFNGEWKDYGSDIDHYGISCSGSCDLSNDKNCNITKTGSGYHARWKLSKNEQKHTIDGTDYITRESTLDVTVSPYKEPDKPEVTLYGCSDLETEEQSNVMASGKPEGGKFRFWVEPDNLLNNQSDGESSANLTGATPGKGTLYVEYTSPEGKINQTSQPASCVKIENYNGGQDIPQIALYDIDGKKLSGVLKIPVSAQPSNIEELVDFVAADKTVLSAVGLPGVVELTGSRKGTTTLQAKTNCGNTTGPAVEVEVVNCDKETVEALDRMRKAATENLVDANNELRRIAGSKEFEKARDELVSSTVELLAKAGLTIIANGKTSGVVKVTAEIADKGSALSEIIASSNPEELKNNIGKTASGETFEKIIEKQFGDAIGELYGKSLSAAIGVAEVAEAAQKFGENAGQILYHEEVLKSAMDNFEKAYKDLEKITRQQQLCKGEKTETPKKDVPKTEPKPDPTKPNQPTKPTPPAEPTPKTEEPPVQEPQTDEPTADDEVLVDPEPPTIPPRQVGLPYEPGGCGCNTAKELTTNSKGFSTLGTGIQNLSNCVDKFRNTSLTDYQQALAELKTLTDSLLITLKSDPAVFIVKAKKTNPRLDSIVKRTKSYDEAGNLFLKEFDKCPETVSTGMEVLRSAETITIDSVKTNY